MQGIPMFKFIVSLPGSVRQKTEFGQSESVWKQQFCRETVPHSLWAASMQLISCCYYQDLFYSAFWNRLCSPLSSKAMSFTITFLSFPEFFSLKCMHNSLWLRHRLSKIWCGSGSRLLAKRISIPPSMCQTQHCSRIESDSPVKNVSPLCCCWMDFLTLRQPHSCRTGRQRPVLL